MNGTAQLRENFRQRFGTEPRVFRAPGRVNLIGEHTDYNDGFVMPAALGFECRVAAAARADRKLVIHSENFSETCSVDLLPGEPPRAGNWCDYPVGVAVMLGRAGFNVPGANLLIRSDVPLGAGLSSSAAIEVATACALLGIAGQSADRRPLAQICQRAEHEYPGVRCGIMDPFIALHGLAGHALLLDCRSLDFERLPLPAEVSIVICNTLVRHELASGEYNRRRADCEEAVRLLAARVPGMRALRDVTPEQLEAHPSLLPERVARRARHVVTENARAQHAAAALRAGDIARFGRLMFESHASLRDDYEVSCRELDVMVQAAAAQPGVYGARMTGGGFGGCTVNLVESRRAAEFTEAASGAYLQATGIRPEIYACYTADAAGEIAA